MLALIRLGAVRYLDHFDHQYMIMDYDDQTPITGAVFPVRHEVAMQGITDGAQIK